MGLKPIAIFFYREMSLRGGTTKQPRRVQYTSEGVATLSLAMTH
jgi:hypothetical protein